MASTQDLLKLINSLSSSIKANGSTPISPEAALAAQTPQSTAPFKLNLGSPVGSSGGGSGWSLNPLKDVEKIGGDIKSGVQYALPKVTDILSRGQYAAADASKAQGEYQSQHSGTSLKDLFEGFIAKPAEGALQGLEGKKKESFQDVIQTAADIKHNEKAGLNPTAAVNKANTNPGTAHVNPIFKTGAGLTADILGDPTTYLGTGLAGKVGKEAEAATKVVQIAKDAEEAGVASKAEVVKNLNPLSESAGKVVEKTKLPTPEFINSAIKSSRPLVNKLASKAAQDALDADPTINFAKVKAAKATELTDLLESNLRPETARALGIKFAGTRIAHIPYESLAQKVHTLRAGDGALNKSMNLFRTGFKTGLPDFIAGEKRSALGAASQTDRTVNHNLVKIFGKNSPEDLNRTMEAIRRGDTSTAIPSKGVEGVDLVSHTRNALRGIQDAIRGANDTEPAIRNTSELNRYMDPKWYVAGQATKSVEDGSNVLPEDWLEQTLQKQAKKNDKDLNNPAHVIFSYSHALGSAKAMRKMLEGIGDGLGHKIVEDDGSKNIFTPALMKRGYAKAVGADGKRIKYLENHIFDPETRKGITNLDKIINPKNLKDPSGVLDTYDKALRIWKAGVTKYNPGYHERNLMGDVFANLLAGGVHSRDYWDSSHLLKRTSRYYHGNDPDLIKDAAKVAGASEKHPGYISLKNPLTLADGTKTSRLDLDHVRQLGVEHGIKTGFLTTEFGRGLDKESRTGLSKVIHSVQSGVQKGTEDVEDFSRFAHFISRLKNAVPGSTLEAASNAAAKDVIKYHFDYSDFTRFERNFMTRLFPFYKWTRKNIPLQLERTLATPGKVLAITKGENALSNILGYPTGDHVLPQGDAIAPSWLRKDNAFPVGGFGTDGDTVYDDPPLPWQQAFETIEQPKDTIGQMSSPIFQLAVQALTGKTTQGYNAGGVGKTLENETPYSRLIAGLAGGNSKKGKSSKVALAQFLTGLGLVENTAKMQSDQTYYSNAGSG